ncbi:hypothetical protein PHYBOEH_012118 [Phytophthora boehmeriae]|uniref:EDRF1 N-terminal domain-containing protein n=1 Tax=Phytophthora boehmeriae TaxID=109152 RepID=A0A8T1VFJ5_9STRA|nr:hypothetical protein PHYBOEH_012118 [Phytophthora boehmeriae]
MDDLEECGVASFALPPSPVRSPTGSDNVAVWVEDADGEQRVHLGLHSPRSDASNLSDALSPTTSTALVAPGDTADFPLVLWESRDASAGLPRTSSAIVPFQKLRLDTNLHQTTLPYKLSDSPRSRSNSSSPTAALEGDANGSSVQRAAEMQLASGFLGMESSSESSPISEDFMNALRLGDLTQQEEPQLSVRLRGSRVELASASEEEQVDFLGPAENIKRLFKLPYSQSRVSLAVHRVGSTLVVDGELNEKDLPAGFEDLPQDTLQLAQQSEDVTQRLLYEKFIYESTVRSQLPAPENDEVSVPEQKEKLEQLPHRVTTKKHGKKSKKAKKAKQKTKSQNVERTGVPEPLSIGTASQIELLEATDAKVASSSSWVADIPPSDAVSPAMTEPELATPSSQGFPTHPNVASTASHATAGFAFAQSDSNAFTSAGHHAPAFGDSQTFQRILKWKFHDLKMVSLYWESQQVIG